MIGQLVHRYFARSRLIVVLCALMLLVLPLPATTPSAHAYSWPRTLRIGMSGEDVRELQIRVAGWAADSPTKTYVAVDGIFGDQTYKAVTRFQSAYGLTADGVGVAGPETQRVLNSLESSDGSTAHFDWSEFTSHDCNCFSGGKVSEAEVRANIRRLMWKLEALRKKSGDHPVTITSGFRTISHNRAVGGASNSQHMYGDAADIIVSGRTKYQTFDTAATSGFSGIFLYNTTSHTHVDSRIEYRYGAQFYCWDRNGDGHCDG